ncbi:glycosyl transferase family 2 [Candidatus Beckwithbacteria bacterium CG10_big_fil_rev_8_21_14_0_10_34_10]|uniref:Glycosyl transferase family 2 n=1 Tax=Candidatus Beckwithbacteria bacterium CG10_big_fil_rev_8_21_14_0_10_34_10 TaxID=1974495 RepID=A0A2H0WBD9_9BACT|nr:MAG: glycosyl transferase family 2 [Candidatus Beckwithbacteria bacterium CG10_big_fil_rev_8_21_14_0_10_34_10]
MDLSIIIVNYNTKDLVSNLIKSFLESDLGKFKVELTVIDNGSKDGSQTMFKKSFCNIKYIFNKENLGFSKANNQGIRISRGKYILLLNSDTLLKKNTLKNMLHFMKYNKYVAGTCKIELINGQLDPACHRGFPTPWAALTYFSGLEKIFPKSKIFGQYHQTWKNLDKVHSVDAISGAFFMIKKEVLDKVGLLDEQFFMYAEDIDLAYRIKESGYKIGYNPNTKIIHFKKSSGRRKDKGTEITQKDLVTKQKSNQYFFETMKLFYDKHYKNKYPKLIRSLVLLGIYLISRFKD